jgi:hypothetical protein
MIITAIFFVPASNMLFITHGHNYTDCFLFLYALRTPIPRPAASNKLMPPSKGTVTLLQQLLPGISEASPVHGGSATQSWADAQIDIANVNNKNNIDLYIFITSKFNV